MKRRWLVGGLVLFVVVAATLPDLRLGRELAAARAEGLWTSAADVRRAAGTTGEPPLADALVHPNWARERTLSPTFAADLGAAERVYDGSATAADRSRARKALVAVEPTLAQWRAVGLRQRLVADRNYEDGFGTLFPEYAPLHMTVHRLVAAARLGMAPRENLLAAARLSALVRAEPGVVPAASGTELGLRTLRVAASLGLGKPVEAALGPSPDVRRVLGPELPAFLVSMDYAPYMAGLRDMGVLGAPWFERAAHYGPLARGVKAAGVARWRVLWSRLPKDGRDYDGAARVVDEELPKLDLLMPSYADTMAKFVARPGDPGRGGFLRAVGELERERAAVRGG